jgi:hypothetical protein
LTAGVTEAMLDASSKGGKGVEVIVGRGVGDSVATGRVAVDTTRVAGEARFTARQARKSNRKIGVRRRTEVIIAEANARLISTSPTTTWLVGWYLL